MSRLHFHSYPCCMSMRVLAAHPCFMSTLNITAWCSCCLSMPRTFGKSMEHVHAACPVWMSMLYVHSACLYCMTVLHAQSPMLMLRVMSMVHVFETETKNWKWMKREKKQNYFCFLSLRSETQKLDAKWSEKIGAFVFAKTSLTDPVSFRIGLIMIIISLRFSRKKAPNDNHFSRKNYVIIAIIVISRKIKF